MAEQKWMWQRKWQIGNSDLLLMLGVPSCKHNSSTCKSFFFWLQAYQPISELKMLFPRRIKEVDWSQCEKWLISLEMSGGCFRGTCCPALSPPPTNEFLLLLRSKSNETGSLRSPGWMGYFEGAAAVWCVGFNEACNVTEHIPAWVFKKWIFT